VTAVWRTGEVWEGFRGMIHGGIVSTVLDEAMSKAVAATGICALTCDLRVRLRQRIEVGEELRIRGWVVEKRKRRIVTEATLRDSRGQERAHAWATFLELPQ
jgi:acyl-coenzyme A thioesterase PaaI-like protein